MKAEEDHFRYDAETLIYGPLYEIMDLNLLVKNFMFRMTEGNAGRNDSLSKDQFDRYIQNQKLKNGFVMTALEFGVINGQLTEIISYSENLIQQIETEIIRK